MVLLPNSRLLPIPALRESIAPDSIGPLSAHHKNRPTINPPRRSPAHSAPILPLPQDTGPGHTNSPPALLLSHSTHSIDYRPPSVRAFLPYPRSSSPSSLHLPPSTFHLSPSTFHLTSCNLAPPDTRGTSPGALACPEPQLLLHHPSIHIHIHIHPPHFPLPPASWRRPQVPGRSSLTRKIVSSLHPSPPSTP